MEAFLKSRVAAVGLDEEVFVPYLSTLLEEDDGASDVRERLTAALENAGAVKGSVKEAPSDDN
jgi:hypothetical protein